VRLVLAAVLALAFTQPAQAWPCFVVRAYAKGKSTAELEQYAAKNLTAEQRSAALACLHRKDRRDRRCDGPARYEAMSEGANCS
jgi:hypothetical protein